MVTDAEYVKMNGNRLYCASFQDPDNPMTDATNLYQQLADTLAAAIQQGTLPAGRRLLSVRLCSRQHALSINTVTAAYRLLEDRGLIEARPKSGYFVCSQLPVPIQPLRPTPRSERQPNTLTTFIDTMLSHQAQPDYIDFGFACPRGKAFYPSVRLSRLTAGLLRRHSEIIAQYAMPPGSLMLRNQIALRLVQLGVSVSADQLILTHGVLDALNLAIRAVTRPGDRVIVETPTYFNIYSLLDILGVDWVEVTTHPTTGMDLDELEQTLQHQDIAAIITMPTVHNPLGFTMSRQNKQRLADLAHQYQVPVIEDAQHADLQFANPPEPSLKAFDQDGWIMTCASYTKTLAPDFRIGWIAAGRFQEQILKLKFLSSVAESTLLSDAIALFLENGGYEHHLRKIRRLYAGQIAVIRGIIARDFPAGTRATEPTGGFILWLELPERINSLELAQQALAEHILCIPGQLYSTNQRYRHCLRLSCCFELTDDYMKGLSRLGALASALLTQP
jgi:DNA-binding transcriptional MocR family regulator